MKDYFLLIPNTQNPAKKELNFLNRQNEIRMIGAIFQMKHYLNMPDYAEKKNIGRRLNLIEPSNEKVQR